MFWELSIFNQSLKRSTARGGGVRTSSTRTIELSRRGKKGRSVLTTKAGKGSTLQTRSRRETPSEYNPCSASNDPRIEYVTLPDLYESEPGWEPASAYHSERRSGRQNWSEHKLRGTERYHTALAEDERSMPQAEKTATFVARGHSSKSVHHQRVTDNAAQDEGATHSIKIDFHPSRPDIRAAKIVYHIPESLSDLDRESWVDSLDSELTLGGVYPASEVDQQTYDEIHYATRQALLAEYPYVRTSKKGKARNIQVECVI